jgi:hypothetical protein
MAGAVFPVLPGVLAVYGAYFARDLYAAVSADFQKRVAVHKRAAGSSVFNGNEKRCYELREAAVAQAVKQRGCSRASRQALRIFAIDNVPFVESPLCCG